MGSQHLRHYGGFIQCPWRHFNTLYYQFPGTYNDWNKTTIVSFIVYIEFVSKRIPISIYNHTDKTSQRSTYDITNSMQNIETFLNNNILFSQRMRKII